MILMRQLSDKIKPEWDKIKSTKDREFHFEDCEPKLLTGWTDNNPSLWDVTEDSDKPTFEKIIVALCRRLEDWEKVAYIKFNKDIIDLAKLNIVPTNGNTSDPKIDLSKTHYEIKDITAKQICTLLYYITQNEFEIGVFRKKEFDRIILAAYDQTQTQEIPVSRTTPHNINIDTTNSTVKINFNDNIKNSESTTLSKSNISLSGTF